VYQQPTNYPWVISPVVQAVHKRPDKELKEIPEETKKILKLLSEADPDRAPIETIIDTMKNILPRSTI